MMGRVGQVLDVTVRDPWPSPATGQGIRRSLSVQEARVPMYVTTVSVEDIPDNDGAGDVPVRSRNQFKCSAMHSSYAPQRRRLCMRAPGSSNG